MGRAIESNDDCCKKLEEEEPAPKQEGPPDGGWGWFVVIGSFVCNIIVDGICYTISFFRQELMDHFKCDNAQVALVTSLLTGGYLTVGPLVSALANKYGCRKVTIIGAIVASAAFCLATQSSSIEMFIISVGIFGGIGFGMIYLPAIVTVGFWFDKKRAFATGIAVCGTGTGTFLFVPLVSYLIDEFGWQGAILILAGVILNCVVCGALFRRVDKKPKKNTRRMVEIQRGSIMKALIEEKKRQRTISNGSLDNCIITKDNRLIKIDPSFFEAKRNNSFIARFKESLGFSTKSLDKSKTSLVIPSIKIDQVPNGSCMGSTNASPIYKPSAKTATSQSSISTSSDSGCNVSADFVLTAKSCDTLPGADPWKKLSQDSDLPACSQSYNSLNSQTVPTAGVGASIISIQLVQTPPTTRTRHRAYRSSSSRSIALTNSGTLKPGSFVSGSMMSIPQFSVTTIDHYEENHSTLRKLWNLLKEMFDFSLLKSKVFSTLVLSSVLSMLAFFVPYLCLVPKAEQLGYSKQSGALLISIIGITNTIGRIISGWIADRPWTDSLHLNNIALICAGLANLAVPFILTYEMLAVYSAVFGMCIAVFVSLRSILLVDLLGVDMLTKSFGILILFQGVASIVGLPLAAKLWDMSGTMDVAFYFGGALLTASGLIGLPLRRIKMWELGRIPEPLPEEMPINGTIKLEVESNL